MSEKKAAVKQQEKKKSVIYLGPTIPGKLITATVFNNGLTAQAEEVVKEVPAVNALLVETCKAALVRAELKRPGSPASLCYARIAGYVEEGGKKE